ncbi:MAG: hypothetical protein JXR97_14725 [Planctomycetes bacterium]|nr:hypothetical protein [Planctomycetota bacterium]
MFYKTRLTLALLLGLAFIATAGFAAEEKEQDNNTTLDARQPEDFTVLPATKDADGDFLVDQFETELINAFAPYLIYSPNETCWPSNVNHHLSSSLGLRLYDKNKSHEFATYSKIPNPKTWTEVMNVYTAKCASGEYHPEDMYFALPIDKSMLTPGEVVPDCPAGDFRYERTGAKSIADSYKARVMIPSHRKAVLDIEIIEDSGDVYKGSCSLNIFGVPGNIPDEIKSDTFEATCDNKKRQVEVEVTDIRKALGIGSDNPLPEGPVVDWSKATITVLSRADRLEGNFVPQYRSARGEWLKGGRKTSAYVYASSSKDPQVDTSAITNIWGTTIPRPTGASEIYAHVYPTANYIIIQYWLFYGYTDHEFERHEGDWGNRIDVVLYRNAPEGSATNETSKPIGVVPAYRNSKPFNQRMVAMVVFSGNCGKTTFKRDQNSPTLIKESRSKYTLTAEKTLRWCGSNGLIAAQSTHPVAYVAKGSHQMYPVGGKHKRTLPANKFKKIWNLVSGATNGYDECATDSSNNSFSSSGNPVRVLPQTTAKAFIGQAQYKVGDKTVTLNTTGTSVKIVNVGELSSVRRESLMRYDGKVCKELTKSWGHILPAESEEEAIKKDAIRNLLRKDLEAPVKQTLTDLKESEKKAEQNAPASKSTKKKSVKVKADERVKQIKSKKWKEITEAKKKAKEKYPNEPETELNERVVEVIQDVLGVTPIKPLLILSRTKPMTGGEFIDYPGRWGRILSTSSMSELEKQQIKNYLSYDPPEDGDFMMLRKWRKSGPVGLTGAKPQRYLMEFYHDYDSAAKQALVYGVEIDL